MKAERTVIDRIEMRSLYIFHWQPTGKKKRGRPRRPWNNVRRRVMENRDPNKNMAQDKEGWGKESVAITISTPLELNVSEPKKPDEEKEYFQDSGSTQNAHYAQSLSNIEDLGIKRSKHNAKSLVIERVIAKMQFIKMLNVKRKAEVL
ncbi:hypothetical protein FQA39_LY13321 [Lamprigera yunnana]|nr:hypothetical protein FQA39_LY13321 [Lamprigera yunnana]